ncbi:MAG: endonuclease [Candidatus Thorarchaeota archaeon]|nr:MAG: endonuclease [Candidatus Thorarchaeota archaeon]
MALEETLLGLAIGLLVAVIVFIAMRARLKHRIAMVESEFRRTWAEQEAATRRDAAQRSRYVLKGKIAEHIVPLLSDIFRFNPADARFIGAPVDYLIFDGYTDVKDGASEGPITIVLADVKTGDARLSRTERKIKEAVESGRVRWETIRVDF